jgi:hypothetical protein
VGRLFAAGRQERQRFSAQRIPVLPGALQLGSQRGQRPGAVRDSVAVRGQGRPGGTDGQRHHRSCLAYVRVHPRTLGETGDVGRGQTDTSANRNSCDGTMSVGTEGGGRIS